MTPVTREFLELVPDDLREWPLQRSLTAQEAKRSVKQLEQLYLLRGESGELQLQSADVVKLVL